MNPDHRWARRSLRRLVRRLQALIARGVLL